MPRSPWSRRSWPAWWWRARGPGQSLGQVRYGATQAEQASKRFRRSLYVVRDMAAGEVFDAINVRAIRPGLGLAPKHLDSLLGRKARGPLKRGTALDWSLVE